MKAMKSIAFCFVILTLSISSVRSEEIRFAQNVKIVGGIVYAKNPDQSELALDLYFDRGHDADEKLPVALFIHGGGWSQGSRRDFSDLAIAYAGHGFASVCIDYRKLPTWKFPACVEDTKCSVRWIRAHADEYGFDADRICAIGASAGGHLTGLIATSSGVAELEGSGGWEDFSSAVACAVPICPVMDLERVGFLPSIEEFIGVPMLQNREAYKLASPVHHIDETDPPVLLVHGTLDPLVPISQSRNFLAKALEAGVDAEIIEVEGGDHEFTRANMSPTRDEMLGLVSKWVDEKLEVGEDF
ncbi:MAG: alpha/beta hydrolase [Planctomycetes bacterium]|nr:alpha/beta hydrolase [Planctomycetota bacterium]